MSIVSLNISVPVLILAYFLMPFFVIVQTLSCTTRAVVTALYRSHVVTSNLWEVQFLDLKSRSLPEKENVKFNSKKNKVRCASAYH